MQKNQDDLSHETRLGPVSVPIKSSFFVGWFGFRDVFGVMGATTQQTRKGR
jgi:hypothetical protein